MDAGQILSSKNSTPQEIVSVCSDISGEGDDYGYDQCMKCFFLSRDGEVRKWHFRTDREITFDTGNNTCSVIPNVYIYHSYADCEKASSEHGHASWLEDECKICIMGENNEFAHIDGKTELGGIVFIYNEDEDWTECDIYNHAWVSCAPGWYGRPEYDGGSSLYGCSECPKPGTTTPKWDGLVTTITDCYISDATKGTDTKGTYKYTSDCYYTK